MTRTYAGLASRIMVRALTARLAVLLLVASPAAPTRSRPTSSGPSPADGAGPSRRLAALPGRGRDRRRGRLGRPARPPDLRSNLWTQPGRDPRQRARRRRQRLRRRRPRRRPHRGAALDLRDNAGPRDARGGHDRRRAPTARRGRRRLPGQADGGQDPRPPRARAPRRRWPRASATRPPTARGSSTSASRRRPTTRACARRSRRRGRRRADRLLGREHGADIDRRPLFPVAIPAPNLVGVAATAPADGRALTQFSNYGPLSVPVAAPGEGVVSTARDGGYETRSGTSMAAPHVAGVAALMASANPRLSAAGAARAAARARGAPPGGRPARATSTRWRPSQAAMRTPQDPLDQAADGAHRRRSTQTADALRAQYRLEGRRPRRAPPARRRDGRDAAPERLRAPGRRCAGRPGAALVVEALGADGRVLAGAAAFVGAAPPPPPTTLAARRLRRRRRGARRAAARPPTRRRRIQLVGGGTDMGIADAARGIVDAGPDEPLDLPRRPARASSSPSSRSATAASSPTASRPSSRPRASRAPRRPSSSRTSGPRARACSRAPPRPPPTCGRRPAPGATSTRADSEGLHVGLCRSYPLGIVTRGAPGGALAGLLRTIAAP